MKNTGLSVREWPIGIQQAESVVNLLTTHGHLWHCVGMSNLKRYVTFLTEEQLKKLQTISTKTGAPISSLIRMAVAESLKKGKNR